MRLVLLFVLSFKKINGKNQYFLDAISILLSYLINFACLLYNYK